MIQQLIKEKGHLSISALTVAEFIAILDTYKEGDEFGEKLSVIERKEDHLVDLKELESVLNTSRSTIYRMRQNGRLPEYIVNGKAKFNIHEVKRALKVNSL